MKILHTVESYLPSRHGMSEFVRQISERLAAAGHDVTVATGFNPSRTVKNIQGVKVEGFAVQGKSAVGISGDISSYQRFLLNFQPDVIVNFAAQQWATDLVFPILPLLSAKKVFVPTGFSALGDPAFQSYFNNMRSYFGQYDACIFCSDEYRDVRFARESGAYNTAFIPVGAAAEEYDRECDVTFRSRHGIPPDDFLVTHAAGYLSRAKGQLEALQIFSRSKLRNSTLLLISPDFNLPAANLLKPEAVLRGIYHILKGNGMRGFHFPAQLNIAIKLLGMRNRSMNRRVITAGLTQDDKVQAFLNADLFLFPSWIECSPLVIYEAAASQTPFMVTDVGNASEIIRWTGGGELLAGSNLNDREGSMVADVESGARALTNLWSNPGKRLRMAQSGHEIWKKHFTWEVIAEQYEKLYAVLLSGEDIRGRFVAPPDVSMNCP